MAGSATARADSFAFEGALPMSPHVLVDLTHDQLQEIAKAHAAGNRWPEIALTTAQGARLREASGGETPRWVFAVRKEDLAGQCTCDTYNLGVIVGTRLAVLLDGLGDYFHTADVLELERALVDPRLATSAGEPPRHAPRWHIEGPPPTSVRALLERSPAPRFDRSIALPPGWATQSVRLAALPLWREWAKDPAAGLHALASISARPAPGNTIEWPKLGARMEVEGAVLLLVPGVEVHPGGPHERAWFLLEYRGGRLVTAGVVSPSGKWGVEYDWPSTD
jgi:hypothetical protein